MSANRPPSAAELRPLRPVFVTGASSGIGRAVAVRLSGLGYPVFASARRAEDLEDLGTIAGITPVRLDVRDAAQAAAALELVRKAGRGLYALVNNAGVGGIGPIAAFTDEEIRDLFEVNVFGVVRMTRTLLPLILESKGRVVLIGSQGGSIASSYYGPYAMTKHALEAFALVLDSEIRPHGARALIIQPGGVRTPIGENSLEADRERFRRAPPPFDVEAREIAAGLDAAGEYDPAIPESAANRNPCPPGSVARVVLEQLEAPDPPLRHLVGTRWEGDRVIRTLLERLVQANACPSLRYSREELIRLVDEALARNS